MNTLDDTPDTQLSHEALLQRFKDTYILLGITGNPFNRNGIRNGCNGNPDSVSLDDLLHCSTRNGNFPAFSELFFRGLPDSEKMYSAVTAHQDHNYQEDAFCTIVKLLWYMRNPETVSRLADFVSAARKSKPAHDKKIDTLVMQIAGAAAESGIDSSIIDETLRFARIRASHDYIESGLNSLWGACAELKSEDAARITLEILSKAGSGNHGRNRKSVMEKTNSVLSGMLELKDLNSYVNIAGVISRYLDGRTLPLVCLVTELDEIILNLMSAPEGLILNYAKRRESPRETLARGIRLITYALNQEEVRKAVALSQRKSQDIIPCHLIRIASNTWNPQATLDAASVSMIYSDHDAEALLMNLDSASVYDAEKNTQLTAMAAASFMTPDIVLAVMARDRIIYNCEDIGQYEQSELVLDNIFGLAKLYKRQKDAETAVLGYLSAAKVYNSLHARIVFHSNILAVLRNEINPDKRKRYVVNLIEAFGEEDIFSYINNLKSETSISSTISTFSAVAKYGNGGESAREAKKVLAVCPHSLRKNVAAALAVVSEVGKAHEYVSRACERIMDYANGVKSANLRDVNDKRLNDIAEETERLTMSAGDGQRALRNYLFR